jgi:hypothetical protein
LAVSRGITFDSQARGDAQIFAQLRILSEADALMGNHTTAFQFTLYVVPREQRPVTKG